MNQNKLILKHAQYMLINNKKLNEELNGTKPKGVIDQNIYKSFCVYLVEKPVCKS